MLFEKGQKHGFEFLPNWLEGVDHTALDVVEQYQHAKEHKYLAKDNAANYNNRWLQVSGTFIGKTKILVDRVRQSIDAKDAHIYANFVKHGNQYGRHNDPMSVLIVQVWNSIAYCVESEIGDKQHTSFILNPGDAIYIHKGTWHTPIISEERMTLSFSW